jgi:hypothetical protein
LPGACHPTLAIITAAVTARMMGCSGRLHTISSGVQPSPTSVQAMMAMMCRSL